MTAARVLLLATTALACYAGCIPISGTRITGRDLAQADPQFARLPPTLAVGFSLAPGAKRVFSPAELERIAHQNGIGVTDPGELCFVLSLRHIGENEMRSAMMRALPAGARIQFADTPSFDVPEGTLSFLVDQLEPAQPGSNGVRLWRGYVNYGDRLRTAVQARVVITIHAIAVVAVTDLPAGEPIPVSALRTEMREIPPQTQVQSPISFVRLEDIAGKAPKHRIQAGATITMNDITDPPCVRTGDTIRVEVNSGFARLGFDATVQSPARLGEIIELKNPISGKPFRARLISSSRAIVLVGPAVQDGENR